MAEVLLVEAKVDKMTDDVLNFLATETCRQLDEREAAGEVECGVTSAVRQEDGKPPDLPQVCPKCGGRMEQGFIDDMATGDLSFGVRKWARGLPLRSLLFKTWVLWNAPPVGTFRCESCGYLESYAREEFATKAPTRFSLRSLLIFVTVVSIVLGLIAWAARS